ncbi:ferritin-like domain-containing protein [Hygrophoropsis aurantiaca]|uniref:Ferritin-like domain-containing protein n=1 Tax=Hygrophoropsis aurantiaca TaxID=72124 RepID=A0ACB7ZXI3_9AGAM|nr:ferritin-like domain-containing protein [Hygrophoropsis aurantiaca]
MRFSATFSAFCIAAVHAVPTKRDSVPTVPQILNYALTLEYLENAFYAQGLQKYQEQDFEHVGLPDFARGRFLQVAQHEAAHVEFLETALGDAATKPCTYKFPDTDAKSFAAVSYLLENVGTSAYSGAAKYLSGDTLTAAASILAVEARHGAWVNSAVLKANPWNTAFDTPLDLNQVYTLASSVIVSCPSSNPALPVKAFPALQFPASVKPGTTAKVTYKADGSSGQHYVAFISGLNTQIVPLNNMEVNIPGHLEGVVYAVVTSNANTTGDDVTVAGPAFLSFDFGSDGKMLV